MSKPKPCPFCGREAVIVKSWESGSYVRCSNGYKCGARQDWFDSEKEAIEAWNRRVNDDRN